MKLNELKKFCENKQNSLLVHNAQFENKWFLSNGINARIDYDTRLEARLFDERLPADLNSLVLRFEIDKYYKTGDVAKFEGKELKERPSRDARNTLALHEYLYPKLTEAERKVYHEVLVPAAKTLAQIELEGICVSPSKISEVTKRINKDLDALKLHSEPTIKAFIEAWGKKVKGGQFNVGSSKQKQIVIYDILGYPVLQTTDSGAPSTEAEVVEALLKLEHIKTHHKGQVEECKVCQGSTLSKIDKASKWIGWRDKFLKHLTEHLVAVKGKQFVFTDLLLAGAATGRLISSNPNMQNTPRGYVREVFIPRYDFIWEFDYKGIEWRVWVCLAKDDALIEAVRTGDPHANTAADIFAKKLKTITKEERFIGKTFNFTIINGGGPFRLTLVTGLPIEQTEQMFKRFWKAHPRGQKFWEKYVEVVTYDKWNRPQSGWVHAPTGMKRYFEKPTEARNHLIQNPALVVMLKAANKVVPYVKDSGYGVVDLTVHDSLRTDGKKSFDKIVKDVKAIMEEQTLEINGEDMELPFEVEVKRGKNWSDMEDVKL